MWATFEGRHPTGVRHDRSENFPTLTLTTSEAGFKDPRADQPDRGGRFLKPQKFFYGHTNAHTNTHTTDVRAPNQPNCFFVYVGWDPGWRWHPGGLWLALASRAGER